MTTDSERLRSLIARVERERSLPETERPTTATDASIDGVLGHLGRGREQLVTGNDSAALDALRQAKYHVAESWSYQASLSNDVVGYVSALERALQRRRR